MDLVGNITALLNKVKLKKKLFIEEWSQLKNNVETLLKEEHEKGGLMVKTDELIQKIGNFKNN